MMLYAMSSLLRLYRHLFCVCLPISQVAEKSKRKTDAVEDPQIRGGNGWRNGKNRGLIMVNIVTGWGPPVMLVGL